RRTRRLPPSKGWNGWGSQPKLPSFSLRRGRCSQPGAPAKLVTPFVISLPTGRSLAMSDRLLPLLARLAHRTDLVIAILVLVAVVMMLVPLPTGLVDVLIATNIAISVLILLAALY